MQQVAGVQHPDDLIERIADHWQPGMAAGLDGVEDFVLGRGHVDGLDLRAGGHDLADGGVAEVENRFDQFAFLLGDDASLFVFLKHGEDFLLDFVALHGLRPAGGAADNAVGDMQEPNQRAGDDGEPAQRAGGGGDDQRAHVFRKHLRQKHTEKHRDQSGEQGRAAVAIQIVSRELLDQVQRQQNDQDIGE